MFLPPQRAFPDAKVIHLQPYAPRKPRMGQACNGCGVCCAVAPCPLGILLSRRLHGACVALRWDEPLGLYRCGALNPSDPVWRPWPSRLRRVWARLAQRWIAAGQGCDSALEVQLASSIADNASTSTREPHDR